MGRGRADADAARVPADRAGSGAGRRARSGCPEQRLVGRPRRRSGCRHGRSGAGLGRTGGRRAGDPRAAGAGCPGGAFPGGAGCSGAAGPPAAPHVSSPPAVPAPPTAAAPSAGSQPAAVAPAAPGATAAPGAPPATRSAPGKTAGQRTVHRTPREPSRPGRATRRAVGWHPLPGVRTATRATPLPPLARPFLPTRSDVRPAAHVHRDAPTPAGRTHRAVRPGAIARVIAPPAQLPASPALPPAGVEGAAAGGPGGAAGATAAALLTLVGICLMRALLPGRLALGLAPWQSAQLVCRLERPG